MAKNLCEFTSLRDNVKDEIMFRLSLFYLPQKRESLIAEVFYDLKQQKKAEP